MLSARAVNQFYGESHTLWDVSLEIAAGAGFLIPICGDMLRMPGLPYTPAAEGMRLSDEGVIEGLS